MSKASNNRPVLAVAALTLALLAPSGAAHAGAREQAKRIHDRLAGVPPSSAVLDAMTDDIAIDGDPIAAANRAMANDNFYNVTLKNWITPWTNEEQTVFAPLNDYTATAIGMIRDDKPFSGLLSDDILYVGAASLGLPAYSTSDNNHYERLEESGASLLDNLVETTQSAVTGLDPDATAGIMTTRAAAKAYYIAGTNRAMLRFTFLNHLCTDLDPIKDASIPPDRIRQDVSRSPGGDSRIFLNNCIACHAGMDPLAQAYAYYDYAYDPDADPDALNGSLAYTAGAVHPKYLINADNFRPGFVTENDEWINYWREGPNRGLGWDETLPGSGSGAKSLGRELAGSRAFAACQVRKAFRVACLREPSGTDDEAQVTLMTDNFVANNYRMKQVFAEAAAFCMGD